MQAVAGTHTVLLGFSLDDPAGCLGFAIHRTDHTEGEARWLRGMKTFGSVVPEPPPGSDWPTNAHPVQGFQWGDYAAKPGTRLHVCRVGHRWDTRRPRTHRDGVAHRAHRGRGRR